MSERHLQCCSANGRIKASVPDIYYIILHTIFQHKAVLSKGSWNLYASGTEMAPLTAVLIVYFSQHHYKGSIFVTHTYTHCMNTPPIDLRTQTKIWQPQTHASITDFPTTPPYKQINGISVDVVTLPVACHTVELRGKRRKMSNGRIDEGKRESEKGERLTTQFCVPLWCKLANCWETNTRRGASAARIDWWRFSWYTVWEWCWWGAHV